MKTLLTALLLALCSGNVLAALQKNGVAVSLKGKRKRGRAEPE